MRNLFNICLSSLGLYVYVFVCDTWSMSQHPFDDKKHNTKQRWNEKSKRKTQKKNAKPKWINSVFIRLLDKVSAFNSPIRQHSILKSRKFLFSLFRVSAHLIFSFRCYCLLLLFDDAMSRRMFDVESVVISLETDTFISIFFILFFSPFRSFSVEWVWQHHHFRFKSFLFSEQHLLLSSSSTRLVCVTSNCVFQSKWHSNFKRVLSQCIGTIIYLLLFDSV